MRALFEMMLKDRRENYQIYVLRLFSRYGFDIDTLVGVSTSEAVDDILNEATAELFEDRKNTGPFSDTEVHHRIRARISTVFSRETQTTRNRRRSRSEGYLQQVLTDIQAGRYAGVVTLPVSDEFIFNDFLSYLGKVEPRLVGPTRTVLRGHTRPADLARKLRFRRTDADYIFKRLRKHLRDYLDAKPIVRRRPGK